MQPKKKVIAYFDGFNYYEALRSKRWRHYYWQDLTAFATLFLKDYQELVAVRYFSAIQHDVEKAANQDKLFQINRANPKFNLVLGEFKRRQKWKRLECSSCKKRDGYKVEHWEEKKSDVALASFLIRDVALKQCDTAFLFSADSDMTPAVDVVRELNPSIKIIAYFPPGLTSFDLNSKCTKTIKLENHEEKFKASRFADKVLLPDGFELECPAKWSITTATKN